MERKVNIQDWQKVTVEDFNNFGLFPRYSFDHIVGDVLIPGMADIAFFEGRQTQPVPPAHAIPSPSPLQVLATAMECNPVGSVMVTPIVQDQVIGDYVREIRIFSAQSATAEPIMACRCRIRSLLARTRSRA